MEYFYPNTYDDNDKTIHRIPSAYPVHDDVMYGDAMQLDIPENAFLRLGLPLIPFLASADEPNVHLSGLAPDSGRFEEIDPSFDENVTADAMHVSATHVTPVSGPQRVHQPQPAEDHPAPQPLKRYPSGDLAKIDLGGTSTLS